MADIETLATGTINKLISKTDYLVPYITEKDRGPAFDGYICAYRKKGDNHSSVDRLGQAWVQVKGRKTTDVKKERKTYSVSLTDIKLYLQEGGVLFFVVYITEDSEVAFYSKMLPYDLKKILQNHSEQASCSIDLIPFPEKKEDIANVVINFIKDRDKQRAAIHSENVTVKQLKADNNIDNISFGYVSTNMNQEFPMDYLLNHDFYVYADIGYGIELPVEHVERIETATTIIKRKVCVGDRQFYSSYLLTYKSGMRQIRFGNALKITEYEEFRRVSFEYIPEGTLNQRINDEEFLAAIIENNEMIIEGTPIKFPDKLLKKIDTTELKKHLHYFHKVRETFNSLHVKKDLDCDSMDKKDEANLRRLVSAVDEKNLIELRDTGQIVGKYTISNIKLLIFAIRDEDSGLFKIYDFFNAPIEAKGIDQNEKEFVSTPCVHLTAENLLEYDNIDYTLIMAKIRSVAYTEQFENQLIVFLLQVIKAYDLSGLPSQKLMQLAKQVNEYIKRRTVAKDKSIIILNDMQLKKRVEELSSKDEDSINRVIQKANVFHNERILTGAYLLLNKQTEARKHYDHLTPKEKKEFDEFPICKYKAWE